jgi:hypothetical protein
VLWEVFYAALTELRKDKFLMNVEVERLFPNIKDLRETCTSVWQNCLYPLYKQCQQNGFRLHPFQIVDAFEMVRDHSTIPSMLLCYVSAEKSILVIV